MVKLIRIISAFDYDIVKWKEAAWAVANALDGRRSPEQFRELVWGGALQPLCKVLANYSRDFAVKGDEGVLKSETTFRLLRCLDQATIHLPELGGHVPTAPRLISMIEEVFASEGYSNYRRDSKTGVTSPDPGSDFEQKLTLAMKRFSLDDDPEDSLTKKMNTVKIKESDNNPPPRSYFHFPVA